MKELLNKILEEQKSINETLLTIQTIQNNTLEEIKKLNSNSILARENAKQRDIELIKINEKLAKIEGKLEANFDDIEYLFRNEEKKF